MKKRPTMLSATFVKSVNVPGRYGDGRGGLGLTLLVKPSSRRGCRKSWGQNIRINGRKTTLGLGTYPVITLAMARERALENARAIALGRDPRRASIGVPSFASAAETVLAIHAVNWKPGSRSKETWRASLRDYALPRLGSMRVDAVTTSDVMAVLLPIWSTKRETARRLRHRIGAVMKWAVAQGYRIDNPAGDAISGALPKTGARIEHRKALPPRRGRRRPRDGTRVGRPPGPRPGLRFSHTDHHPLGRGPRRPLVGDRQGRRGLDGSG